MGEAKLVEPDECRDNPLGSTTIDGGVSRSERVEPRFDYPCALAQPLGEASLVEPDVSRDNPLGSSNSLSTCYDNKRQDLES